MAVDIKIPELGNKFQDYRQAILGDSFTFGPTINAQLVKYFAFHHSVTKQTAKNDGNWKAECDVIANLHVKGNGWAGIGYRFVICSDGTVAYVGDLARGGAAVTGNNHQIFSACFVGDFTKELPTAIQVYSAHLLQKFFRTKLPQYPLIDAESSIIGHRDAAELLKLSGATPTACPGSNWRTAGDNLRSRILANNFKGYPNPQPPSSVPVPTPPAPTPPAPIPVTVHKDPTTRVLVNGRELELRQVSERLAELEKIAQRDLTIKSILEQSLELYK